MHMLPLSNFLTPFKYLLLITCTCTCGLCKLREVEKGKQYTLYVARLTHYVGKGLAGVMLPHDSWWN